MPSISLDAVFVDYYEEDVAVGPVVVGVRNGTDSVSYTYQYDVIYGQYEAFFDFIPTSISMNGEQYASYDAMDQLGISIIDVAWGGLSTTFLVAVDDSAGFAGFAPVAGFNFAPVGYLGQDAVLEMLVSISSETYLAATDTFGPGQTFSLSDLGSDLDTGLRAGNARGNRMNGNASDEVMFGLGGRDNLRGRGGDDALFGGLGNDRLNGGTGHDFLSGYEGRDRLAGARGNDELNGGAGRDMLNGGVGRDILIGGEGSDRLVGGRHADVFVFNEDHSGRDVIRDFGRGNDLLEFHQVDNMSDEAFISSYVTETDRGLWIAFGENDGVLLLGVDDVAELRGHIDIV